MDNFTEEDEQLGREILDNIASGKYDPKRRWNGICNTCDHANFFNEKCLTGNDIMSTAFCKEYQGEKNKDGGVER